VTDDGKLLAYYVRHGGADETETRFYDVDGRHDTGALVPMARYQGLSVSPDHRTVYYARHDKEGDRVYGRPLDGGAEEKLFGDGYGPEKITTANLSDDGRYL
jgi:prolyl oligopeptidase